jgi:hypothetical protein
MSEHYLLKHFEVQQARLVDEARRERLKAEVLAAARRQRPSRRAFRLPALNLLGMLRATLQTGKTQPEFRDCAGLESSSL